MRMGTKGWDTLTTNTAPGTAPYNQEGTPTPSFSLRNQTFGSHLAPQLWKPPPSWESQRSLHPRVPQDYSKEVVLTRQTSVHQKYPLRVQRRGKTLSFWKSFPGRDLTAYFINCCLRVHFLIGMHLGADCDPPWTSKEPVGNPPPPSWFGSFQQQIQVTSISLEAACTYIWHPRFYSCHLRDSTPDCLALIANVACIRESRKTVLDKEVIVNGCTWKPWLQLSPRPGFSTEGANKKCSSLILFLEGIWLHTVPGYAWA